MSEQVTPVYFRDEEGLSLLPIGCVAIMEAMSFELEVYYAGLLFKELGIDTPKWYPFPYGAKYTFLTDVLRRIIGNRGSVRDETDLCLGIAWLALNPGGSDPEKRSILNHSGMKLYRLLLALAQKVRAGHLPTIEELERHVCEKWGYRDLQTAQRLLKSMLDGFAQRLEIVSGVSYELEYTKRFVKDELTAIEIDLGVKLMTFGEHLQVWTTSPKPPFTFTESHREPGEKELVAREESGLWAFLHFLEQDVVAQALNGQPVLCPMKTEGVYCPLKEPQCGTISSLFNFEFTRKCSFEVIAASLASGRDATIEEHNEFLRSL